MATASSKRKFESESAASGGGANKRVSASAAGDDNPFQFDFKKGGGGGGGSSGAGKNEKSIADREREYLKAKAPQFMAPAPKQPSTKSGSGSGSGGGAAAASTGRADTRNNGSGSGAARNGRGNGGGGGGGSGSAAGAAAVGGSGAHSLATADINIKLSEDELDDVLKLVDEAPDVKELDLPGLRQLIVKFEKCVSANVEMRAKYHDKPEKFMESELNLHDSIVALQPLGNAPSLYPEFLKTGALASLLGLVAHENVDVAISVVDLLHELVELKDDDTEQSETERASAIALADALVAAGALPILINNLDRLDEAQPEDSQAVFHTLNICENLIEIKSSIAVTVCQTSKLLDYIMRRIAKSSEKFDSNTLYASEILSIVLNAGAEPVRKFVGQKNIFQPLRVVLTKYRLVDPATMDETEFVENLFSALCFALTDNNDNQIAFDKAGGLKLLLSMAQHKLYCKSAALKVLDFALTKCQVNCVSFVEQKGLKTLFAAFMGKSNSTAAAVKKMKKYHQTEQSDEEHVVSCIAQLFMNLSDVPYARLLNKFQENEYEKIERLIELQEKYYKRLEDAERKYQADKKARKEAGEDDDDSDSENDPEEVYMRRIDAGLFHLQQISFVVGFVSTCGDAKLKERVIQLMHQQDSSLAVVKNVLIEWSSMMLITEQSPQTEIRLKQIVDAIAGML